MNDHEKLEAISACFTHAVLQCGNFQDLSMWVDVSKRMFEIIDARLLAEKRAEINRRLLALESPAVIELMFDEITKGIRNDI